jgi:uncharacterized protein (TIGR02266 family)
MIRTKDEAELATRIIDRSTANAQVVVREAKGAERRTSTRYDVTLRVTLLGDHNFYVGLTENLSEGGLFVQTQQVLPVGTALKIDLTLPTSSSPLILIGVVRWVRSPNAVREEHDNFGSGGDEAFKPGMGIQLVELTADATRVIEKFISIRNPDFYA